MSLSPVGIDSDGVSLFKATVRPILSPEAYRFRDPVLSTNVGRYATPDRVFYDPSQDRFNKPVQAPSKSYHRHVLSL